MDVRKICKVFLDFIYENNVLPKEIVDIIDKYQYENDSRNQIKYDVRVILNILRYRDSFKSYGYADFVLGEIQKLIGEKKLFDISVININSFIGIIVCWSC